MRSLIWITVSAVAKSLPISRKPSRRSMMPGTSDTCSTGSGNKPFWGKAAAPDFACRLLGPYTAQCCLSPQTPDEFASVANAQKALAECRCHLSATAARLARCLVRYSSIPACWIREGAEHCCCRLHGSLCVRCACCRSICRQDGKGNCREV